MDVKLLDEILDMAIAAEENAARSYRELARRSAREDLRELLVALAAEEDVHRVNLERVREGDLSVFASLGPATRDLVAPSAVAAIGSDASPAQALLVAIEQEQRAFQLYMSMAADAGDPETRILFEAMAREEASHWHRLESAYDRYVLGSSPDGGTRQS